MPDFTLDELIGQSQEAEAAGLRATLGQAVQSDPSSYAKDRALAQSVGVRTRAVQNEKVRAMLSPLAGRLNKSVDEILGEAPKTSQWLQKDEDNAPVAWTTLDQLIESETRHKKLVEDHRKWVDDENRRRGIRWLADSPEDPTSLAYAAHLMGDSGQVASLLLDPGRLEGTARRALGSLAGLGAISYDVPKAFYKAALPEPVSSVLEKGLKVVNPIGWKASEAQEYWQKNNRVTESLLMTDPKTGEQFFNWGAYSPFSAHGLENIVSVAESEAIPFAAQAFVAAETGGMSLLGQSGKFGPLSKFLRYATSPSAGLEIARTVQGQFTQNVQQEMAKGLSREQAEEKVAPAAVLAGGLSFLAGAPMEAAFFEHLEGLASKTVAGATLWQRIASRMKAGASAATKEGLQEVLNGLGEDASEYFTFNPDKTGKEFFANAVQNFVGGAVLGGPTGAAIQGSHAQRMANQEAFVKGLHEGLSRTELAKVAPDKLAEYVSHITEGGPVAELAVGAQAWNSYWQSIGEDPAVKAAEMGVDPQDYAVATEAGGDLVIPTGNVAQHIAGTEHFDALFKDMKPGLGRETFGEIAQNESNARDVEDLQKLVKDLPESKDRDTIRGQIASELRSATKVFTPGEVNLIADGFAKVIVAQAQRAKLEPLQLFERERLNITSRLATISKEQEARNAAQPEGNAQAPPVQGTGAAGDGGPVRGGEASGRSGVPSGELAPAPAGFEFAAGVRPPARLWHGTVGTDFDQLKAEGLTTNQLGGIPGLNLSAGPHVAESNAEGNPEGLWKASLDPNTSFFDASTEKVYTPDQAALFGLLDADQPYTGHELWEGMVHLLGSPQAAADLLGQYGFGGLYYNHGGEDAWAVFKDSSILRSAKTTMEQASAEYALQGSRRDPNTGFLKVGQTLHQSLSSRVPSTVKAKANLSTDQVLLTDFDTFMSTPALLEAVPAIAASYPGVRLPKNATPEKAVQVLIKHFTDNLMWLHNQIPEEVRKRAAQWYDGANTIAEAYTKKYGKTLAQISAVFATLSPQMDWFKNVSLGERVMSILAYHQETVWDAAMTEKVKSIDALAKYTDLIASVEGRRLGDLETSEQKALWLRVYDETYNDRSYHVISPEGEKVGLKLNKGKENKKTGAVVPGPASKVGWGALGEIAKAIEVFESADPATISEALGAAHKVRSFYNNIFNPMDPRFTTIDTHAVGATTLLPVAGNYREVAHAWGASQTKFVGKGDKKRLHFQYDPDAPMLGGHGDTGLQGLYAIHQEAYRRAAEIAHILPRQMQSITWEAIRGLFGADEKGEQAYRDTEAIWLKYKKGKITADAARAQIKTLFGGIKAPDWHDAQVYWQNVDVQRELSKPVLSVESMPGSSVRSNVLPGVENATPAQIQAYHQEKMSIVEGVLREAGVPVESVVQGEGYWDGETNPVSAFRLDIDPNDVGAIQNAAAIVADLVGDQDAIGWNSPVYDEDVSTHNGVLASLNRALTKDEAKSFGKALDQLGLPAFPDLSDLQNLKVINYDLPDGGAPEFHAKIKALIQSALPEGVLVDSFSYRTHSGLVEKGTSYEAPAQGSPAVLGEALNRGRAAIKDLNRRASEAFGPEPADSPLDPDGGVTLYQPAYHGSPFKFDAFSLEHLGRGEGPEVQKAVGKLAHEMGFDESGQHGLEVFMSIIGLNPFNPKSPDSLLSITGEEFYEMVKAMVTEATADPESGGGYYANRMTEGLKGVLREAWASTASSKGDRRAEAASKVLNHYGLEGIKYEAGTTRGGTKGKRDYNYVIFNDATIKILNTFYQDLDLHRGALQFRLPDGSGHREFNLALLEHENKSTIFHELGHFYLEMLGDLATLPQSDQSLKDDYATVLKWFGITDRSQITRDMHEQFADAHLQYLLEGNAPSLELVGPFRRFSNWLMKIGKQLLQAAVPMNDEIRGVFDRLYAADHEIEAAKGALGPELFTTAEQAGLSQAEFNLLKRYRSDAISEAKEKLTSRLMRELERERKKEWREELAAAKARIGQEVDSRPEYKARKALKEGITESGLDISNLNMDEAAPFLGYDSADQLSAAIRKLEPRDRLVNRMAREYMVENHGDLLATGVIHQTAVDLLNGAKKEQLLAAELNVLRRLQKREAPFIKQGESQAKSAAAEEEQARAVQEAQSRQEDLSGRKLARDIPRVSQFKEMAKHYIGAMPVFKLRPIQFLNQQQSWARQSYLSALRNDYLGAAEAKEKELLNHHLYLESVKALQFAENFRSWVRRNDSPTVRGKIGKAGGTFLAQFDALRDRFGIERIPNKDLPRTETLSEWAQTMESQHEDTVIDPMLLDESFQKNYRELSTFQLKVLHEALKNIKHLAYRETTALIDGQRIERAQIISEIVGSMQANLKPNKVLRRSSAERQKALFKIQAQLTGADASLIKIETLVNWIDGNDVNGPMHRYVFNRLAKAQTAMYDLESSMFKKLIGVLESMPEERRKSMSDSFDIPGFGPATRSEIITMALYYGQESRRAKLLHGYASEGLSETNLRLAFTKLNEDDAKLINEIWATFSELQPKILDLEERLSGVRPEWERATPFDIEDQYGRVVAHLTGGYFPLVADPSLGGELGKKQEGGPVGQLFQNGYARASTSRGHTKELTKATYPLWLDFQHTLTSGLANQIKDLTYREAVLDINRIFRNTEFTKAAKEHLGEAYEEQLMPWLVNIVNDRNAGSSMGLSFWNNLASRARANTIAAVLGFKYSSGIVQIMDVSRLFTPGQNRVKARHFTSAFLQFLAHPVQVSSSIFELSGEMRHRAENLDRDMRQRFDELRGDLSMKARWNRNGFKFLSFMDALVSRPAWLAAYNQSLESGAEPAKAILEADRTVRLRLMSSNPKDLTAVQRGNELLKLATMFLGDATSNYNMLRDAGHNIDGLKGIPTFTATAVVVMMAGALGELIKGQGPDDDEDWRAWLVRKAMLQPFQTVPIVRDMAGAVEGAVAGKPFKDYKFSPAVQLVQKIIDVVPNTIRFAKDEEDWKDYAIHAGEAIGWAMGIGGTAQAAASAKYLKRYSEGEEQPANTGELVYNTVQGKRKSR